MSWMAATRNVGEPHGYPSLACPLRMATHGIEGLVFRGPWKTRLTFGMVWKALGEFLHG